MRVRARLPDMSYTRRWTFSADVSANRIVVMGLNGVGTAPTRVVRAGASLPCMPVKLLGEPASLSFPA